MPDVRRQRGAAPASCTRLESRHFPAHVGDAGADQRLDADEPEEKIDQDRREGGKPRPLYRLPDGRGRHPTANVPRDSAADCGTTAAATTSASVRRSTVMRLSKRREECVQMPAKIARLATRPTFWIPEVSVAVRSSRPSCSKAEKREYSWQIGCHPGNPGLWVSRDRRTVRATAMG